jgi:hypothetical protein
MFLACARNGLSPALRGGGGGGKGGETGSHYVSQAGFKLAVRPDGPRTHDAPVSASQGLELQSCPITSDLIFSSFYWYVKNLE